MNNNMYCVTEDGKTHSVVLIVMNNSFSGYRITCNSKYKELLSCL